MSIRRLFLFFVVAVALLTATGIQTKSQDPGPTIFAGVNVNMASSKTWPDPDGDVYLQRQNEPSLAVSTLNPLHLLAGSNDYRSVDSWESVGNLPGIPEEAAAGDAWVGVFKSYDGGQSWKSKLLPGYITDPQPEEGDSLKTFDAASDPTVRAGVDGLFFISGIAFKRGRNMPSVIFVSRYKDYNDTESGDSIRYIDTTIVDEGTSGQFADKPWLAVDVPRPGYPDGIVYLVYSTFLGELSKTVHNKIMLARSIDGGKTWETPVKLSEGNRINQGTTVAIDPQEGYVYIAWRRWAAGNDPDAIMVAKSTDYGQTFTKAEEAAIIPFTFDQPTWDHDIPSVQFRTNAFPTMAIDNNHRVYIAWAQREYEDGPARIFFTSSEYGTGWPTQTRIHNENTSPDDYNAEGHQFMPSMTFAAGKLLIAWYDSRESVRLKKGGTTQKWLTDYYLGAGGCPDPSSGGDHPCYWRETIDIRIAQADPNPVSFEPSAQVSRYLWFFEVDDDGNPVIYYDEDGEKYLNPIQVQFNPPNYPLFHGGTAPFIGDYIDLVPAPMFIKDAGTWRYNTGQDPWDPDLPPDPFVFYVSWTDNRDVRPPADDLYDLVNPWEWYGPPDHVNCESGFNAGMRNQNIYVSRITSGISVGCPANYKPRGHEQRTFVVNVENMTSLPKSFNMTILNPPPNGTASFSPIDDDLDTLNIDVDEFSSISRHVFVQSNKAHTTIVRISESGGDFIGYVNLYLVATGGSEEESIDLNIIDGGIINWSDPEPDLPTPNADIFNWRMFNWRMFNWRMFNWRMFNSGMFNWRMFNWRMYNTVIQNASIINPTPYTWRMFNGNMANPLMSNNSVDRSIDGAEVVDKFWQVTNTGDTSSSYTLKTIAGEEIPGYYCQLLVYKVHRYPASGLLSEDEACTLLFDDQHELLLNIDNPNVTPDISTYSKIVDPDLINVDFTNATFSLAPGEEAVVILRVIDTSNLPPVPSPGGFGGFIGLGGFGAPASSFGLQSGSTETDPEDYADNVGAVVISHSSTEGDELTAVTFMVLPDPPDPGQAGVAYVSEPLRAIGGTLPYTWSLHADSLPLPFGLELSSDGVISGIPKEAGDFPITVQVTDGSLKTKTDTQKFTLTIANPDPITITMTPPDAPDGTKSANYFPNVKFSANGGVLPYIWSLSGQPPELSLTFVGSDSTGETMELTGIAEEAGDFIVIVTVKDDFRPSSQEISLPFDLCIKPLPLIINTTPSPLPEGYLGSPYDATLSVINNEATPTWTVKGLPNGLSMSSLSGEKVMITGTPSYDPNATYPEEYEIVVKVTDDFTPTCFPNRLIEETFKITVNPKQPAWFAEGTQDGEAIAVATDEDGNVYVTGYIIGEGEDYYTVKYDVDGNFVWGKSYNGPGNGKDRPSAIAVDSSGVYVTGTSLGDPTGPDIYTVKYALSDGEVLWQYRYDGPAHLGDGWNALTLDKSGNPQGAGYVHRGKVKKHADYSISKYSPLGEMIWDERYDSTRNGNDVATAIAVDSSGNAYVTGMSKESLPKRERTTHDFLTLKFNSSGTLEWTARDDGLGFGDDEPTAIALHEDPSGAVYIYVTGYATGGDAVEKDFYTVGYDANGNDLWPGGKTYNGPGNGDDIATSIAVDETGDVYVTGKSSGTNGFDYATVKYSSDGTPLWDKRHDGGIGNDEAVAIAVDGSDVYVAGFITKEEDGSAADKDFFVIKYDTSGDIIWIASYDGSSGKDDVARDMAVNGTGIYVVGYSEKVSIGTVFAVVKYDK
jgi:hypothetical protein